MSSKWEDRVRALFAEAMRRPPSERDAFVKEAAADNEAMVAEVLGLVAAAAAAGHFMSNPSASPFAIKPGDFIDEFRVIGELDKGGFGVVFLAHDTKLNRSVALKVIIAGMDTANVIARFEQERQTLAQLDHPHIAKVFGAGATQSGWPYFVMEFVANGASITEYADAHRLTLDQRLELFTQVCDAVHYANDKTTIHRDLKPANVLVSVVRDRPSVKVIDFGIAKSLRAVRQGSAPVTESGQFLGTPDYMSPEQLDPSEIQNAQTDVYGLGALLYELLVGVTPFGIASRENELGPDEMATVIRALDPPKPAERLARLGSDSVGAIAATRQSTPKELVRSLSGKLEWILLKALKKRRQDRYQSAREFGDDIRKYLSGDSILAHPDRQWRVLVRSVWRNRTWLGITSLLLAVLVGGWISTAAFQASQRAKQRSEESLVSRDLLLNPQVPAEKVDHHTLTMQEIANRILAASATDEDRRLLAESMLSFRWNTQQVRTMDQKAFRFDIQTRNDIRLQNIGVILVPYPTLNGEPDPRGAQRGKLDLAGGGVCNFEAHFSPDVAGDYELAGYVHVQLARVLPNTGLVSHVGDARARVEDLEPIGPSFVVPLPSFKVAFKSNLPEAFPPSVLDDGTMADLMRNVQAFCTLNPDANAAHGKLEVIFPRLPDGVAVEIELVSLGGQELCEIVLYVVSEKQGPKVYATPAKNGLGWGYTGYTDKASKFLRVLEFSEPDFRDRINNTKRLACELIVRASRDAARRDGSLPFYIEFPPVELTIHAEVVRNLSTKAE